VWDKGSKQDGLSGQNPFVCRLEAQSAAASVLKNTVKKPKALKPADFKAFGGRPFCKKSTANRLRAKSPLNAISKSS
jgi:hypothetical protein